MLSRKSLLFQCIEHFDFKVTNQAGQAAAYVFWTGPKIIAADILTRFYYHCFVIVILLISLSFMGKFYKHHY